MEKASENLCYHNQQLYEQYSTPVYIMFRVTGMHVRPGTIIPVQNYYVSEECEECSCYPRGGETTPTSV